RQRRYAGTVSSSRGLSDRWRRPFRIMWSPARAEPRLLSLLRGLPSSSQHNQALNLMRQIGSTLRSSRLHGVDLGASWCVARHPDRAKDLHLLLCPGNHPFLPGVVRFYFIETVRLYFIVDTSSVPPGRSLPAPSVA